ncbi:MAG TPA: hypothetical protein V6D08_08760, partial [Candidatus Obscuribacterales bacterium]
RCALQLSISVLTTPKTARPVKHKAGQEKVVMVTIFIGIVLAAFVATVGMVISLVCMAAVDDRGPRVARLVGIGAALLTALAFAAVGWLAGYVIEGVSAGLIAGTAGVVSALVFAKRLDPDVDLVLYPAHMARAVRAFGLRYFDNLDRGGKGVLTRQDLAHAECSFVCDLSEREILRHMRNNISRIGHWVDAYETETSVAEIASESGKGASRKIRIVHSVFVISRHDLESYPRRARRHRRQGTERLRPTG